MTAAGLFANAVGALTRGGFVDELSRRANRQVYQRGFQPRRGIRRHARQRHQWRGRHVQAPPGAADHRSRGRPRLAGPSPRTALSRGVRRMDGGCRRGRCRGMGDPSPRGTDRRRSSRRTRTTSIRSSGGRTAATTIGRRAARLPASAGSGPPSARCTPSGTTALRPEANVGSFGVGARTNRSVRCVRLGSGPERTESVRRRGRSPTRAGLRTTTAGRSRHRRRR